MIQVQETEETRVKTRNSIRKVPVHPKLLELEILDYIQRLKKQNKERFFWEPCNQGHPSISHLGYEVSRLL